MRQQVSSTRSSGPLYVPLVMTMSSNVDNHLGQPAVRRLLHAQAVVGDRLDLVLQGVPRRVQGLTPGGSGQPGVGDTRFEARNKHVLGVEAVQELLNPIAQHLVAVLPL